MRSSVLLLCVSVRRVMKMPQSLKDLLAVSVYLVLWEGKANFFTSVR